MGFVPLTSEKSNEQFAWQVPPQAQAMRDSDAANIVASEYENETDPAEQAIIAREYRYRFKSDPPTSPGAAVKTGFTPIADEGRAPKQQSTGFVPLEAESPSILKTVALENPATAIGETALNLASQSVAMPLAGLAGLATEAGRALGMTEKTGADVVHSVGEAMTYQPRGKMGQMTTEAATYPFQKLAEAGQFVGGKVLDATGSPVAATVADTAINALPMMIAPAKKAGAALAKPKTVDVPIMDIVIDPAAGPISRAISATREPSIQKAQDKAPIKPQESTGFAPLEPVDRASAGSVSGMPEVPEPIKVAENLFSEPEMQAYKPETLMVAGDHARAGRHESTQAMHAVEPVKQEAISAGFVPLDEVPAASVLDIASDGAASHLPEAVNSVADTLPGAVLESRQAMMPGANYVGLIDDSVSPSKVSLTDKPIRREDVLRPLTKALGVPLYQGRVQGKALGTYTPGKEVVRLKKANDIEVAAHELAHLIDDRIPELSKQYKADKTIANELRGISYDKTKLHEGFAELVRLWSTQPEKAQAAAPKAYRWLESFVDSHEYGKALRKAQSDMTAWFGQDALHRAQSKIGTSKTINDAIDGVWDRFRQSVSDDLHGVYKMERDLTGTINPLGAYETARLSRASNSITEGSIRFGRPVKKADGSFTYEGNGLEKIIEPIADRLDDWLMVSGQ